MVEGSFLTRPPTADDEAFRAKIAENPLDQLARDVYSDYLEENGDQEEADRQRQWTAAYRHLWPFTGIWNDEKYEKFYDDEGDLIADESALAAGEETSRSENVGQVFEILEYWLSEVRDKDPEICFNNDWAADELRGRDSMHKRTEFLNALSVVAGTKLPESGSGVRFRCAC